MLFYEAYSLRSVMLWPPAKSDDRCDAAAVCDAIAPSKVPDDDDQKKPWMYRFICFVMAQSTDKDKDTKHE